MQGQENIGVRSQLGREQSQSKGMEECISNCLRCYQICAQTLALCLRAGGSHADETHIRLLIDCLEVCKLSADFMIRGSQLHAHSCAVCSVVCNRCAQDCENFEEEFMKECAQACRQCEESCKDMAEH
jgi:hypothetical protein